MGLQRKQKLQLKIEELEKLKPKFLRNWKGHNTNIIIPEFVYKTEFGLGLYHDILFC